MPRTTQRPVMKTCRICDRMVYAHNMATVTHWVVEGSVGMRREPRPALWCTRCDRAQFGGGPDGVRSRLMMDGLHEEVMLHEWDGVTTKTCESCHKARPDALFQWKRWVIPGKAGWYVSRMRTCYTCHQTARRTARHDKRTGAVTPKPAVVRSVAPLSPFDITRGLIEAKSGTPMGQWGQALHEMQCVLMRDLAKIPQHQSTDPSRRLEMTEEQEAHLIARWGRRVALAQQYVGIGR